jgi:hypothetical protein
MKAEYCYWCDKPVRVQDNFDPKKQKAVCSRGCRDAEAQFQVHYSDEEINRRAHYRHLTRGGDNET